MGYISTIIFKSTFMPLTYFLLVLQPILKRRKLFFYQIPPIVSDGSKENGSFGKEKQ